MSLSFNVLNQAMLTQVLHELRLGNLQRCKALGLGEEDIYLLQSLPPTTLSRLAHATVRPHYAKHMLALDLKPSEFAVLSLISANPGASQRQIAETVMISQPNMAALMERLQVRGLLRREHGPHQANAQQGKNQSGRHRQGSLQLPIHAAPCSISATLRVSS